MKVAIIPPVNKGDYMANTVLDGFLDLVTTDKDLEFKVVNSGYPSPFDLTDHLLAETDFINYAKEADLVIVCWGKGNGWAKTSTDYDLVRKIDCWPKTVYVDGSEFGKNNRYDFTVQRDILDFNYDGIGAIDKEMLDKCAIYFRREKPYVSNIVPLPYGIERRYQVYTSEIKDIDFVCIFGQDEYPIWRRYASKLVEDFCKQNNLICHTHQTCGFNFDDKTKLAGRDDFYNLLARAKVGISIGGGGYDTARFWEILANNCLLITERVDIFQPDSNELDYNRIYSCNNIYDLAYQLERVAKLIKGNYLGPEFTDEYKNILKSHSTKARVQTILETAKLRGVL